MPNGDESSMFGGAKVVRVDDEGYKQLINRIAEGIHTEVLIKGAYLATGSMITKDGMDNYPVLIIERDPPPDFRDDEPDEFFIIPITPVVPFPMTDIQKNTLEDMVIQLLTTMFAMVSENS